MECQQGSHQDENSWFILKPPAGAVSLPLEIARLSMPLDGDPVVQRLKRKIRVRRGLDFNDHQPPFLRHREQIDNIPLFAHEARHLRINVAAINRRQEFLNLRHQAGLQPPLLVSARKGMPAAVAAGGINFSDNLLQGFTQRIDDLRFGDSSQFDASQPYRDGVTGYMRHCLEKIRRKRANFMNNCLSAQFSKFLDACLRLFRFDLERLYVFAVPLKPIKVVAGLPHHPQPGGYGVMPPIRNDYGEPAPHEGCPQKGCPHNPIYNGRRFVRIDCDRRPILEQKARVSDERSGTNSFPLTDTVQFDSRARRILSSSVFTEIYYSYACRLYCLCCTHPDW